MIMIYMISCISGKESIQRSIASAFRYKADNFQRIYSFTNSRNVKDIYRCTILLTLLTTVFNLSVVLQYYRCATPIFKPSVVFALSQCQQKTIARTLKPLAESFSEEHHPVTKNMLRFGQQETLNIIEELKICLKDSA